jgi:hypothetical protein
VTRLHHYIIERWLVCTIYIQNVPELVGFQGGFYMCCEKYSAERLVADMCGCDDLRTHWARPDPLVSEDSYVRRVVLTD